MAMALAVAAAPLLAQSTPDTTRANVRITVPATLNVGGFIQTDYRAFADDPGNRYANDFYLRRLRLDVTGTLSRYIGFRVVPDFAGSKVVVTDAYADLIAGPALRLRVGKAKVPFSLERAQPSTTNAFIETGATLAIAPNYDIGAHVLGDLLGGIVSYDGGVFNGAPDGASLDDDTDDGKELAGRLQLTPFARRTDWLRGLTFGAGATHENRAATTAAPQLPTYKTAGQSTFLSYLATVTATGSHDRVAVYGAEYGGPFSLLGEWVQSKQDFVSTSTATPPVVTAATFTHRAYQVYGTVVLTGEAASFRGVTPRHGFDPAAGHWGAVELVARYDEFNADDATAAPFIDLARSATRATSRTIGLNWYLTAKAKIVANYQYTNFTHGAAGGANRPAERAILTRLQTVF